jgi:hypothetical protein
MLLGAMPLSSSSLPLADVKPMSNDQAHAMPWLCIIAL